MTVQPINVNVADDIILFYNVIGVLRATWECLSIRVYYFIQKFSSLRSTENAFRQSKSISVEPTDGCRGTKAQKALPLQTSL
jgi:hypothetical protein